MIRLSPEPSKLTFEAELLHRHQNRWEAYGMLICLLEHESPLVREGAVYGLAYFTDMPGFEEILKRHSMPGYEDSPGVRQSVLEVLKDL